MESPRRPPVLQPPPGPPQHAHQAQPQHQQLTKKMKHRNCIDQPCTWGGWEGTQRQRGPLRSGVGSGAWGQCGEWSTPIRGAPVGKRGWYGQLWGVSLPARNPS